MNLRREAGLINFASLLFFLGQYYQHIVDSIQRQFPDIMLRQQQ